MKSIGLPTIKKPSVYIASKPHHADMFRTLVLDRPDVHFTCRWLWLESKIPDSPTHAQNFWIDDIHDVLCADCVILYAEGEDRLRGALVEVGAAIAHGIPVWTTGDHEDYGTWQYHPLVFHAPTVYSAITKIGEWYNRAPF